METLEAMRNKMRDESPSYIYICTICGEEIPQEEVAASFEGMLIDWELKNWANNFRFVICKKCIPGFMRNHGRGQELDALKEEGLE